MKSHVNQFDAPIAISKKELARKMGVSASTLRRLLKKSNLTIDRGLIPPARQFEVLQALGWREMTQDDAK
jgi:transcriptional regulator with XRE-family HTH domain